MYRLITLLYIAVIALTASAYRPKSFTNRLCAPSATTTSPWRLPSTTSNNNNNQIDPATYEKIDKVVKGNKVVLFMKGNKLFPQCGFSNTACRILDAVNTPYETVNVLDDDKVRMGIKVYSSWPTIPQLYVNGEFVGGSDIMIELYQNGQLQEMLEIANAN